MADNVPNSVFSLEGDPTGKFIAQGGAVTIDPRTGDIYGRNSDNLPGSDGWVKLEDPQTPTGDISGTTGINPNMQSAVDAVDSDLAAAMTDPTSQGGDYAPEAWAQTLASGSEVAILGAATTSLLTPADTRAVLNRERQLSWQDESSHEIAFVGDSLTYGEADGVQVKEPMPAQLSTILGMPVRNYGLQGYIPRHRAFDLLANTFATVLKSDLLTIPPTQYEDRINQPSINNLRTFYTDGKIFWMHTVEQSEPQSVKYMYSASSTATPDGDSVLMPEWVGVGRNNPEYLTGRLLKQTGTFVPTTDDNIASSNIIIFLGNNGFEADDTINAIDMILRNRGPRAGWFRVLTISNRQPYSADPATIAQWNAFRDGVNTPLRAKYPGYILDADGYFMGNGSVGTFGCYTPVDANDIADIALGVLPRSVKDTGTHLSQAGYTTLVMFLGQQIALNLPRIVACPSVPLESGVRYWQARSLKALDNTGRIKRNASSTNLATATMLQPPTGSVGPVVLPIALNGLDVWQFDGAATTQLVCTYGTPQTAPNTFAFVFKLDALPTTRCDLIDGPGTNSRMIFGVRDYSGIKRFTITTVGDTGTVVDYDTGIAADLGWHRAVIRESLTDSYLWLDGTRTGPFTLGNDSIGGILLNSGTYPAKFQLAEFMHTRRSDGTPFFNAYDPVTAQKYNLDANGYFLSSVVASGSAVSLTTETTANITSLSVPAGEWNLFGMVDYTLGSATATKFQSGSSSTSATIGGQDSSTQLPLATTTLSDTLSQVVPTVRVRPTATTTYYLVARATFSAGTVAAYGTLNAQRVRA